MKHLTMATGAGGGKQRPPEEKTIPTKTTPTKKTKK
jgi:hypothetical protein